MRIAFVTDSYDGISGGTVTGRRFVEGLRLSNQVTVVSTDPPGPDMVQVPRFRVEPKTARANRFTFGRPRRSILEPVFADTDLVHVQFPFYLGSGATKLAVDMGVPVVAAFHVQPQNLLYEANIHSASMGDWLYRTWIRNVFQPADAVVVPSLFACRRLCVHGLTTPTWVISNGARLHPRRTAKPSGPPFLLLCVGRLAAEKRQDVVIDAVALCAHREQIRLVIAGAGPLEGRLRARAGKRGLQVEFGWVSDEQLLQLYEDATLLIHASEVELEGMAVLDAMAAGLPALVASAPESASADLAAGPDFLFRPGDAADLAAHIDRLLDDPATRASGARRSLEHLEEHDFQQSLGRLERVYEAVLARRHPRPGPPTASAALAT